MDCLLCRLFWAECSKVFEGVFLFMCNIAGIKKAVTEHKPKLLFLTSPNNPDGSLISDEDLLVRVVQGGLLPFARAHAGIGTHSKPYPILLVLKDLLELPVLVVFDEAYIEFSDVASKMSWVVERENLIVLRTFSKCAALAGMR